EGGAVLVGERRDRDRADVGPRVPASAGRLEIVRAAADAAVQLLGRDLGRGRERSLERGAATTPERAGREPATQAVAAVHPAVAPALVPDREQAAQILRDIAVPPVREAGVAEARHVLDRGEAGRADHRLEL